MQDQVTVVILVLFGGMQEVILTLEVIAEVSEGCFF